MPNTLHPIRTVARAAALVIVSACASSTEPAPAITVALSVTPTTVRPTDSAVVTLTVRNVTANTVALQETCSPGTFTIGRIDGAPVALPEIACTSELRVTPLAGGEERVTRIPWRNLLLAELVPTFVLPAGQYRLRATVRYDVGNTVISAPVDVSVVR